VDSPLISRVVDYTFVLLLNWKGLVAGLCLVVLTLPQLLKQSWRSALDRHIPPERRRRILIVGVIASLFVGSFQAYDDLSTKNRLLAEELAQRGGSQKKIIEVRTNPYRAKESDEILNVFVVPTQIILPLTFARGKVITVKDRTGAWLKDQAEGSRIVITADEGAKIDSLPQVDIQANYASFSFIWDGRDWSIY
jgi:hypothetical protein